MRLIVLPGLAALLATGCRPASQTTAPSAPAPEPLSVILAPHSGSTPLDTEIRRAMETVRETAVNARTPNTNHSALVVSLEKLGWLFIGKARVSFDPGFYKMAEQCGLAIEACAPRSPEALLLRGHVLQNLHRFRDAEPIARNLVSHRGASFDFGLLGDVLMEQGKLAEAIDAFQHMADLRPDSQALARIAHVRFLKGDLEGAIEAARDATRSADPRDAESAAWMHTRLALYEFQSGHTDVAHGLCSAAVKLQTNYPPALLLGGRMLLATGNSEAAIELMKVAAELNPLPEYQWALAESFRAAGRMEEALRVEAQLKRTGAAEDPRTYSLFLATRHLSPALALELATRELTQRADVHTHDAMAWALAAGDQWDAAASQIRMALAEGTVDARLLLHAAVVAARRAQPDQARDFAARSSRLQQMLLPSERELLRELTLQLAKTSSPGPDALAGTNK